jgi:hypothetical protein
MRPSSVVGGRLASAAIRISPRAFHSRDVVDRLIDARPLRLSDVSEHPGLLHRTHVRRSDGLAHRVRAGRPTAVGYSA